MAPILYCTCTNCSCTATVLLTQKMDIEGENITNETNNTTICEETSTKQDYLVQKEESQAKSLIEKSIYLIIGALVFFGEKQAFVICEPTLSTFHVRETNLLLKPAKNQLQLNFLNPPPLSLIFLASYGLLYNC